ncbi:MAG: hypothetical protein Ct9H300mP1_09840 [Planctomycetaceae bacterium]|nr:MAG: hypothetical protein Ct9H300mP1_09840 [Planctomycetaceae bacterium]
MIEVSRNFYGVCGFARSDCREAVPRSDAGSRSHFHGLQFLEGPGREDPPAISAAHGGRDAAGDKSQDPADRHHGLGVGTLSVYPRSGDRFTFYELDPDVHQMAEKHFDYLESARRRGVDLDVVIGDAR